VAGSCGSSTWFDEFTGEAFATGATWSFTADDTVAVWRR
jgi:hypothetical protein